MKAKGQALVELVLTTGLCLAFALFVFKWLEFQNRAQKQNKKTFEAEMAR